MLDHKRVDYKLVKLPPGLHAVIMLVLGFETMGVPALKWGDRRVQGTRSISRALDELVPERPLFPSDPVERKAVEDAERWGEEFQNATRRVFYAIARRDRKAFTSVIVAKRSPPMRVFLRVGAGFIIRLAIRSTRGSPKGGSEVRTSMRPTFRSPRTSRPCCARRTSRPSSPGAPQKRWRCA
jgi:hypothetical protein